jgi:DNA-binding LacI/PurR family transcriptional regulator
MCEMFEMSDKKPTIHDVAARAGVSKSLVSLALRGSSKVSPGSREAIERAATELGYRPNATARSLADRRSRTIGINMAELDNPIFPLMLSGAHTVIRERGYNTMLVSGERDPLVEFGELAKLLEFQVEGLILISHRMSATTVRSLAADVPTVVLTLRAITGPGIDSITSDDEAGARMAMSHLFDLGHTAIAHISGGSLEPAVVRERIYREEMSAAGLDAHISVFEGDLTNEGGLRAARQLLSSARTPTAIFASNDISAIGVMSACLEHGLSIPEDISIIGYDGISIGGLRNISLTTISQPLNEMGAYAAERLFDRMDGKKIKGRSIILEPQLVVRGTTAAPKRTRR